MKTQTFGTEIEVNRITREAAARAVAPVLSTDEYTARVCHEGGSYDAWAVIDREGRKWRFVSDASIAGGRDQGTEFVTPVCRWDDLETVQACVRALRAAGAHADASCGIHVHVGLGNHTPKTLRNLVNLVNAKEDLLTQALQISPARHDRWCQPVDQDFLRTLNRRRPTTSEELARIWYDDRNWEWHAHQHYDPSRYHLLNLHAVWQKGTIEFRAFNSSLHAGEVKAYIQNKFHFAAHGHTAAEVIYQRADAEQPFMGLTTFPGDLPVMSDVEIAKNYLTEPELKRLNNLVSGYFDLAEVAAMKHEPMTMKDHIERLDKILAVNGDEVLEGSGNVSHDDAVEKARSEYRKFQVKTLSPVEEAYLETISEVEKRVKGQEHG